jgi:hypothetical protein
MTSQDAEKHIQGSKKRQGTTLVVPQKKQKKCWALAPAGYFLFVSP